MRHEGGIAVWASVAVVCVAGVVACHPDPVPPGGVTPAPATATPSVLAASVPAPPAASTTLAAPAPTSPCAVGAIVATRDISGAVQGSFTAVAAVETAGLVACAADMNAMVVGKQVEGGWQTERTIHWGDSRSPWGPCTPLPTRDGRALLVCSRSAAQRGVLTLQLVVLDLAKEGEAATQTLVSVRDTTDTACGGARSVLSAMLGAPSIEDVSGDGLDDVRVQVRAARFAIPAQPPCKNPGAVSAGQPAHVPQPPARSLEFVLEGDQLQPTTPTRVELKRIAGLGE